MNIFRLLGDLSHLLAIIILLLKIWKTRSCAGEWTALIVSLRDARVHDDVSRPDAGNVPLDWRRLWSLELFTGISGKSQILFAIVYTTRYLDLFTTFISAYNTFMKIVFIATSLATVFLMYVKFKATYDHNHDTFRWGPTLLSRCRALTVYVPPWIR